MTTIVETRKRPPWLLWIAALIVLAAAARFLPWEWMRDRSYFVRWVESIQGNRWAPLIFFGAYAIGSLFAPITPFSLAGGVLFHYWEALFLNIFSPLVGSIMAFGIARVLGRDAVRRILRGKAKAIDEGFSRHGFTGLLVMRLTGVPPFILINYMSGLSEVKLGDYVLATFLGSIHWTMVITYFAHTLWQQFVESGIGGVQRTLAHHSRPLFLFVFGVVLLLALVFFLKRRRQLPPPPAS